MRRNSKRFLAGGLALAAAISLGLAQQQQDETATFRSDTRLVVLHATVIDKGGKIVTNLQPKAFRVFENGVEQPVKKVTREDVPVSMGLIIDNSGSMRTKRLRVEQAALTLVKNSNPEDEMFIVNFNDDAYLEDPGFTNDVKMLERGLSKIDSRGGTAMRDAIRMSIDYVKENGKRDKKVLVVVTDGDDNNSAMNLENLIRYVQRSEVVVYTVGIFSEEEKREGKRARRALNAISSASGGGSYYPKHLEEVDKICQQVAHDIRSQYIIQYSPINQALDGSFRQIKVVANGPNRPTVRTRSGYYATPDKDAARTSASIR
jgi:Ca-activated chloride channel family protein